MKLIREEIDSIGTEIITEDTSKPKIYKIKGSFVDTGRPNRNGRQYMKEHMIPEISRYIRDSVETKRALGELCHPDGPVINPDRVSHLITNLEWQDNLCIGEAVVLDTATGKTLKSFIDAGVSFGVSTRGLGSIRENNGVKFVQPDFRLITVDAVLDPSGISCFTDGILESKEWVYQNGEWVEQYIEESKHTLRKLKASEVEPMALKIFENLITKISNKY